MSVCYNLIACSSGYDNILGVTDTILAPYVNQLVSLNGDLTKKYYVRPTQQLIAMCLDNVDPGLCGLPILPIQYRISSILYNGVEQVVTPQLYALNSGNLQLLDCTLGSCVPSTCAGTPNTYNNLPAFLNNVFTIYNIPLRANPAYFPLITGGRGSVVINANVGDYFTIQIERITGALSPMTYTYGVTIGQNPSYTVAGAQANYKSLTTDNCIGAVDLKITSVVIAEECLVPDPCGCPDGYVLSDDGTECVGVLNVAVVNNPTKYVAAKGSVHCFSSFNAYGLVGAIFYEDITTKPFPIAPSGASGFLLAPPMIDAASNPILITNTVQNNVWGTGSYNYSDCTTWRLNKVGIWTTTPTVPINEWIGFSFCQTIAETKTYYIGIAADDKYRLFVNGTLIVDYGAFGVGFAFASWKIIPITLSAGINIIEGRVFNSGGPATLGFEIYNATLAQLLAVNVEADLLPYIEFSTIDYIGQEWQTGENSGYTCPDGYSLNTCDGLTCTRIDTIAVQPCCYLLTNCDSGSFITTDVDMSQYVGQTVEIEGVNGCWSVTISNSCDVVQSVTVIGTGYDSCQECSPRCYRLINCKNPDLSIVTSSNLQNLVGLVVNVNNDCWTVTISNTCNNAVQVSVAASFDNCIQCLPKCYNLINCITPSVVINTSSNLSQYVGEVVNLENCGDACWYVEEADECIDCSYVEVTESYDSCETCIPPPPELPPIELHSRKVKPGYDTPGCSPEYTEKVNKNYSDALYNSVMSLRYGIEICCQEDNLKWDIKKNLLDLKSIYDPEVCKSTVNKCCPPTCVVTELYIYRAVGCLPPSDVTSELIYPIDDCPAPSDLESYMEVRKGPNG